MATHSTLGKNRLKKTSGYSNTPSQHVPYININNNISSNPLEEKMDLLLKKVSNLEALTFYLWAMTVADKTNKQDDNQPGTISTISTLTTSVIPINNPANGITNSQTNSLGNNSGNIQTNNPINIPTNISGNNPTNNPDIIQIIDVNH